jgi:hypothetical protein
MGYGHLRPAAALADAFGVEMARADCEPLAHADEARQWRRIRGIYEATTRWTGAPVFGRALQGVVDWLTDIPHLHPYRDLSRPVFAVRRMHELFAAGLGRGLVEELRRSGRPLLTTHFAPALAADLAGHGPIWCVVTDADIHRVWAPLQPQRTGITYLAPGTRAMRRLCAYGIPETRIHVTGYPLPGELLGGDDLSVLKRDLAGRLVRLDPRRALRDSHGDELRHFLGDLPADQEGVPPRITFAVGGAGAQVEIVERFLPGLAPDLRAGRWRLTLVAGVRTEVTAAFAAALARAGLEPVAGGDIEILSEPDHAAYFRSFNQVLARTDVLWSKPSEITFFGALGIALVLAPPVGVHESYNRRFARENGAALKQRDARHAHQWLREWLDDGLLAGAAWSGFMRLPKFGLHRIRRLVTHGG